jgi:hypothetical protein
MTNAAPTTVGGLQRLFHARQYPYYIDLMLERLASHGTNLTPGDRGTDFYSLGIAAFASHDYQTATFFFDAAASEDLKLPNPDRWPAHLFMYLNDRNPKQAGREIVRMIVKKLRRTIKDYNKRGDAVRLTVPMVRKHFLRPQMRYSPKIRLDCQA